MFREISTDNWLHKICTRKVLSVLFAAEIPDENFGLNFHLGRLCLEFFQLKISSGKVSTAIFAAKIAVGNSTSLKSSQKYPWTNKVQTKAKNTDTDLTTDVSKNLR